MSVWYILQEFLNRHLLPEERMYRGETAVRMKDLRSLFNKLAKGDEKTGKPYSSDPAVQKDPKPEGGVVLCTYPIDPRVWGRWSPSLDFAKILAGTDKQDTQFQGRPYGGMMMKHNYGGGVVYQPGPQNATKSAQLPSAMDRYDVLMVADVNGGAIEPGKPMNWPPGQKMGMPNIMVRKIAWSPAIGTAEERQARLEALLNGQQPAPLPRRPQPELPQPTKSMSNNPEAQPVPRQGQVLKRPKPQSEE